ncbi:MAG: iron-containing alcohol dehydrogenase [Clostridia bacterium]|nr:iron-containing alcohol dehydrogenase [Clostridia bacterium]
MTEFSNLSIEQLLDPKGFDCSCGKHHSCELKIFKSGSGVINTVPEVVKKLGSKKPMLVCDANTHKAAGEKVEALLKEAGIDYQLYIIPRERWSRTSGRSEA